jgi:hypothetical protein
MCGCGRSATELPARATQSAVSRENPRHVTIALRYRGRRALLIRGVTTGVGYACYPGNTIRVHARDAKALIASGAFARPRVGQR